MLSTYSTGTTTTAASVRFAHLSRLLMIRTVSQTQRAAKATAAPRRTMVMPGSYPTFRLSGRSVRNPPEA